MTRNGGEQKTGCSIDIIIEMKEDGKWKYLLSTWDDEWDKTFCTFNEEMKYYDDPFYLGSHDLMRLVVESFDNKDGNKTIPMLSKKIGKHCEIGDHPHFSEAHYLKEEYFEGFNIIGLPDADLKTRIEVESNFDTTSFYCYRLDDLLKEEDGVLKSVKVDHVEFKMFFDWLHGVKSVANGRETRILFDMG
jgi:hypothetical protein